MVLHEGRCTNCGSILMLKKDQEKGHCLYCDAVFPTEKALQLAENAEGYEFPNLPQEKYEGPNLDPIVTNTKFIPSPAAAKTSSASETAASEKFVPSGDKVPDMNIPMKKKLIFIGAALALILLFAAIMLPLTLRRDRFRAEIKAKLDEQMSKEDEILDLGETIEFHGLQNHRVIMILESAKDRAEAEEIYQRFCETRAEVMGLDLKDEREKMKNVELRLATAAGEGGWVIDYTEEEGVRSRAFFLEKTETDENGENETES